MVPRSVSIVAVFIESLGEFVGKHKTMKEPTIADRFGANDDTLDRPRSFPRTQISREARFLGWPTSKPLGMKRFAPSVRRTPRTDCRSKHSSRGSTNCN